jgi:hypothetical protein
MNEDSVVRSMVAELFPCRAFMHAAVARVICARASACCLTGCRFGAFDRPFCLSSLTISRCSNIVMPRPTGNGMRAGMIG